MSLEMSVVTSALKLLRVDPTARQLELIDRRLKRLALGYCLDGASALEDATHESDLLSQQAAVERALEYFRQGASRNEPPVASICAECVALCYGALGSATNRDRWLLKAWGQCLSDYANAPEDHERRRGNVLRRMGAEFRVSAQLKDWSRAIQGIITQGLMKDIALDANAPSLSQEEAAFADFWQTVFVLELQMRRLHPIVRELGGGQPPVGEYKFPASAATPVITWSGSMHGYAVGFQTLDGESFILPETIRELPRFGRPKKAYLRRKWTDLS